jgi:hypothetical protein
MKNVFVQKGPQNVGKSTTIRHFFRLLMAEHPDANATDLRADRPPFLNKSDIRAVITIGDIKIGIESQGDPWGRDSRLHKGLAAFVNLHCNVIIVATRTTGRTVEEVDALKDHGYTITWRTRSRESTLADQDKANRAEAQWMLDQIQALLTAVAA